MYPSFFLWIVLFPLVILLGMRVMKNRNNGEGLGLDSTRLLFGFVYLGYKQSDYFWEFSKIFLRIGMQLNYELITEQLLLKEVFIGTMLLFYCYWVKKRAPYTEKHGIFNYYDLFINLTLFLNVYQSHLVNTYDGDKKNNEANW